MRGLVELGNLVVLFATATTGLPAYRRVIEGRNNQADEGLDALCPAVFMLLPEVDDEGNEIVSKQPT